MPIVSSAVVEDSRQRDGRRWILERHTDHLGVYHDFVWMAPAGQDAAAGLAARAAWLDAQLPLDERDQNASDIEEDDGPGDRFDWSTAEQLGLWLRERYRTAAALVAARIAVWLYGRTDAELRAWFGLNQSQVDALRTRLEQRRAAYVAVMGLTGE